MSCLSLGHRIAQMTLRTANLNLILLVTLVTIAATFTCSSVWLIWEVNSRRAEVTDYTKQLNVLSALDMELAEIQKLLESGEESEFSARVEGLAETDLKSAIYPDLLPLEESAKDLATYEFKRMSYPDSVSSFIYAFNSDIKALQLSTVSKIDEKRGVVGRFSDELSDYWYYTQIVIILACIIALILAITGLITFRSRKKLRRLRQRNALFMDSVVDCVIICDNQGKIVEFNKTAIEIFGYSEAEVVGMPIKDLYVSENEWVSVQEGFERDSFFKGEIVNKKKNGDHFISFLSANVVYDLKGNKTGTMGISRDITLQKRNEEQFQHIVDNATDIIYTTNLEGEITYVNTSAGNVLGYTMDEFLKMTFKDLVHPDYRMQVEQHYHNQFKSRLKETYLEFKMVKANGEGIWIGQNVKTNFSPTNPDIITGFFGVLRNLDEMKRVQLELKKSEENFSQISKSINDVFFLYDLAEKRYDFISPNCEDVLGVSPDFFLSGADYAEQFVHSLDLQKMEDLNKRVRAGGAGNIEYRRKAGKEVKWIEEKWFPIKNEAGETVSISGICRDITEMKGAYDTIYEQNLEISQSIQYAKNIQESTLPTNEEVKEILPESFVFYQAKDMLSGDLFIVDEVTGDNGESWPAFVVGDCTGHGVPGGLLSLLCNSLLTESLTHPKVNTPAEALDFVREKLIRLFRSNPSKYILDGMDAAFCVLNRVKKELYFSGANLSCYIVRGDEVIEYKGDRQHIGYNEEMAPFVHFTIEVEEGDLVYLTTDGYVDQFGGPRNKKFLRKRLTELLTEINALPMEEQRERIEESFRAWKGDNPQTDDVAIIGVRINL